MFPKQPLRSRVLCVIEVGCLRGHVQDPLPGFADHGFGPPGFGTPWVTAFPRNQMRHMHASWLGDTENHLKMALQSPRLLLQHLPAMQSPMLQSTQRLPEMVPYCGASEHAARPLSLNITNIITIVLIIIILININQRPPNGRC